MPNRSSTSVPPTLMIQDIVDPACDGPVWYYNSFKCKSNNPDETDRKDMSSEENVRMTNSISLVHDPEAVRRDPGWWLGRDTHIGWRLNLTSLMIPKKRSVALGKSS